MARTINTRRLSPRRRTLTGRWRQLGQRSTTTCLRGEALEGRLLLDSTTVFNEIMYHPARQGEPEWIELHNQMAVDMDLSGWSLASGVSYEFPAGTVIPGGGYLVVAADPATLQTAFGVQGALGPWSGRLDNAGERLELRDNNARLMNYVEYDDGGEWPLAADGSGASLAKTNQANGASELATRWQASRRLGGSPGIENDPPMEGFESTLVFNEVAADGAGDFRVELLNVSDAWVDLGGMVIASAGSVVGRYAVPPQSLAAGAYQSWSADQLGFEPAAGDRLFLYTADGQEILNAVAVDESLRGRSPDGTGPWRYPDTATWGSPNHFDFQDAVVINEIMYHHRPEPARAETPPVVEEVELIALDSVWRFNEAGAALPANWPRQAHSVGGDWSQGPGLIGFESPPVPVPGLGTQIADPSKNPIVTYYFETEFAVSAQQAAGGQLRLRHIIDDGAIFYLNGEEAGRFNMDVGPVTSLTTASESVNNAVLSDFVLLPTDDLVPGVNRFSVEVHQGTPLSADVLFGVELSLAVEASPARPPTPYRANDEEWLELYNRGDETIDLTGWRLADAIDYEFVLGTTLDPGDYLVVTSDAQALRTRYPELIAVAGDFRGRLGNGNDRILLLDAANNPVDEVHYFDGGRWDGLADGWGSSLELIDSRADNSRGEAWRASDEGAQSEWHTYTYRGVAERIIRGQPTLWREFLLGFLDGPGEALLDEISVIEDPDGAAVELIQNGSFDDGLAHWRILGNHQRSRVIDDHGNPVLHLVSSGATEYQGNQVETTLARRASIRDGTEYEISFRARWLSGSQQVNSRLYFNRLARTTVLEVPDSSGTPGRVNSRAADNVGPTYDRLQHAPLIPSPGQPVQVTVGAADPDGLSSLGLRYRVDAGPWASLPMTVGPTGQWQSEIPGQEAGRVVQFYVEGHDALGAVSTLPAEGPDSRALFIVEDGRTEDGALHEFRLIMREEEVNLLHRPTNSLSNERLGATVIYEGDAFYNTGVRLKGSFVGRNAARVGFNIAFNPDQLFRGVHDKVAVDRSTHANLGVDEILIKHVANHAGGIPGMYDDLIHFVSPRRQHTGTASLRMAGFDEVYLDSQFENGSDGTVYENEVYRWATSTVDGDPESLKRAGGLGDPNGYLNIDFGDYGDDKETYRWNNLIVSNRTRDDYSAIIQLNKALSLLRDELDAATQQIMDVDQWMRTAAYQALVGPADAYFTGANIHNFRLYARPDGKVLYLPWDWDSSFQLGVRASLIGGGRLVRVVRLPANLRLYYGHMLDIIETTFNRDYMESWTQHYGQLAGQNFAGRLSFIDQRAKYVADRITTREAPPVEFAVTTPTPLVIDNTVATVEGTGWVNVRDIRLAGSDQPLPVTWRASEGRVADTWQASIPVPFGSHSVTLEAYDFRGDLIQSATMQIESTVSDRPLEEFLRVSELHYNPVGSDDTEFLEFVNISAGNSAVVLDLTGVRLTDGPGEPFRFPEGTTLAAGGRLLVVRDREAFQTRYPWVAPSLIVGEFVGRLDNGGERITVVDAHGTRLIDFTYDDDAPWPRQADGLGPSLELINPANTSRSEQGSAAYWRSSALVGGSPGSGSVGGGADFDGSGVVDSVDINLLYQALRSADPDPRFDLTGDGRGDDRDRDALIHDVLKTRFGDANLDLRFDSSDLVRVFQAGEYEDATAGNSTWEEGDWNADGDFNTADLVLAFQDGGYVRAAGHRSPIARDILARDLIFRDTVR